MSFSKISVVQPNIEKLSTNNYEKWALVMKFALLEKNAWGIINGTETCPEINVSKEGTVSEEVTKSIENFKNRERSALSLIFLNVEDHIQQLMENCEDPKTAWSKIKEHFLPDNLSQHMMLFTELLSCRIEPGEKIEIFASPLKGLYTELNAADKSILPEIYVTCQRLRFLPPKFDSINQSITRWKRDEITFEKVVKELVIEETRLKRM